MGGAECGDFEALDLVGGLDGVAAVGDEKSQVWGDDGVGGGAGEAGEPTDVDHVGDEHGVEAFFDHGGAEAIEILHMESRVVLRVRIFEVNQGPNGQCVSGRAEAGDLANADWGDDGRLSEFLAGVDVAEVDFDDGQPDAGDRVAEGDGVVGESARVDDDRVGPLSVFLDRVDEDAFVIGLEDADFDVEFGRLGFDFDIDVGEGLFAVEFRFAEPGHVQVWSVEDEDV